MPRAPTGVSGSGNVQRVPRHLLRRVENGRRLVLVEPLRERHAVVLVVDPVLADRVADAEHRSAEHLAAERARMDDGADVGDREVVEDVVLAGLDVDFDFGEAGDERMRDCRRAGSVSRATPIRPCPASAVADAFVNALMSSGSSWPSNLPPSSIAFCAACASVMLPPRPETRSFATA